MCIVSGGRKGRVGWEGIHDGGGECGRLGDVGGCVGVRVGECVVAYGGRSSGVFGGWMGWCGGMERRDGRGRQGGCQWGKRGQWVVGCMALGDRVLTLVWAGQVWVWACLGVVAHFRYSPVCVGGEGGGYAGVCLE